MVLKDLGFTTDLWEGKKKKSNCLEMMLNVNDHSQFISTTATNEEEGRGLKTSKSTIELEEITVRWLALVGLPDNWQLSHQFGTEIYYFD